MHSLHSKHTGLDRCKQITLLLSIRCWIACILQQHFFFQSRKRLLCSTLKKKKSFSAVCFLSDVFHRLNQLNYELQGRDQTVTQLKEKLHAFQKKLTLFSADLCPGQMLHFPTLHTSGQQITAVMTGFIDALKTNFADRFDHFSIPAEMRIFVKDTFCVNVEGEFASEAKELVVSDEASSQLELNDIQSSDDLRQSLQAGSEMFWSQRGEIH